MSEHHTGPAEVGAPMNYSEHEKTYSGFLSATKYVTILVTVLMIAMAVGFFTTGGFFGGALVFFILTIAGFVLLN